MFARTDRLLLRPGWAEDAPGLARAIADEQVVRHLSAAPWPFSLSDAEAHLAAPRDPMLPAFLIFARSDGAPRLIGSCGLARRVSGRVELGYWISRPYWGQGYATEAGHALIEIATTLGLARLDAAHFLDNPASARVLEKLGFVAGGLVASRFSCARGGEAPARMLHVALGSQFRQAIAA